MWTDYFNPSSTVLLLISGVQVSKEQEMSSFLSSHKLERFTKTQFNLLWALFTGSRCHRQSGIYWLCLGLGVYVFQLLCAACPIDRKPSLQNDQSRG